MLSRAWIFPTSLTLSDCIFLNNKDINFKFGYVVLQSTCDRGIYKNLTWIVWFFIYKGFSKSMFARAWIFPTSLTLSDYIILNSKDNNFKFGYVVPQSICELEILCNLSYHFWFFSYIAFCEGLHRELPVFYYHWLWALISSLIIKILISNLDMFYFDLLVT